MSLLNKAFLFFLSLAILGWTNTKHFYNHSTSKQNYYEFWDYQFVFKNGTKVFLTYSLVNIPALGKKVAAELSMHAFQGAHPSVGRQFPHSDWHEDKAQQRIFMRQGHFMENAPGNNHRVLFETQKNQGFLIDITFSQCAKSGPLDVSPAAKDTLHIISHIPHGQVKGTIAVGKDTLQVTGYGSLVHSWHKRNISDLASKSVFLLGSNSQLPTAKLFQDKNGNVLGIATAVIQGQSTNLKAQSIEQKDKILTIKWNKNVPNTTINLNQVKQRYSALTNIDSWLEKQAARLILGGEMILLRGATSAATGIVHWTAAGY